MPRIDTVLLKVASRCNLDCSYCYVYHMGDEGWKDQPKRMSPKVVTWVADQLAELYSEQEHPFSVVLHGGEPLLIGTARLDSLLMQLRRSLPRTCGIHLQTNGVLLNDQMIDILATHGVGISISLDGPARVHDKNRFDRRGHGSHDRVVAAIRRLQAHPQGKELFSGILAVVDPDSDPHEIYHFLKSIEAPSIDFLYRDGNHTNLPFGKSEVKSVEYGSWMSRILDQYLSDRTPPRIRFLDDMLKLLLGGVGAKEGVGITDYGIIVIDTDGRIQKNDTLKSAYGSADRFGKSFSVFRDRIVDFIGTLEFENYHILQRPSSEVCLSCTELGVCGGGMPAHRWSAERGFNNPSVFCADQKLLIANMRRWIVSHRLNAA